MDEFRPIRGANARAAFFRGGLETCKKMKTYNSGQDYFDCNSSADSLADIIIPGTHNVTTLIRETPERPSSSPGHLFRWLSHLPSLEYLQVFSAEAFEDERARDAISTCQNLKSLELYLWTGTDKDQALSQLLSTMSGVGLRRLAIKRAEHVFQQLSLSALSHYHGKTLTELDIQDISQSCLMTLDVAPNITNLNSCILDYGGKTPFAESTLETISQFLIRNQSLKKLELRLGEGIQQILPAVLLSSVRLKRLSITDTSDMVLPDSFWNAFSSQSDSLECLILQSALPDPDIIGMTDAMLNAIRLLYKLRVLTITGFAVSVVDWDIQGIASSCPNIEHLSLASSALTDHALTSLSTLPGLKTFLSQYASFLKRINSRAPNFITWRSLKKFVDANPRLHGLMIYTDDSFNPYPANVLAELKERVESRGGWFASVEAGNFL